MTMSNIGRLWMVAPVWRATLAIAICASALGAFYPPKFKLSAPIQIVTALPPGSYTPTNSAVSNPTPVAPAPSQSTATQNWPASGKAVRFGEVLEWELPFAGRMFPLPSGGWRVVASLPTSNASGVALDMVALANESGGTLQALLLLIGNDKTTPNVVGFRADGNCERSDIIFTHVISNEDFGDQDCQYIDFIVPQDNERIRNEGLLRAALGDLKERNIAIPGTLIGPTFRFGNRRDVFLTKFYFNAEASGLAPSAKLNWLDNDWNKYNLAQHADKEQYIGRLRIWLTKWEDILRDAWNEKPIPHDPSRALPN